jgi:hypothetical protein
MVWQSGRIEFQYLDRDNANALYLAYDNILRTIVGIINNPENWVINDSSKRIEEETTDYGQPFS